MKRRSFFIGALVLSGFVLFVLYQLYYAHASSGYMKDVVFHAYPESEVESIVLYRLAYDPIVITDQQRIDELVDDLADLYLSYQMPQPEKHHIDYIRIDFYQQAKSTNPSFYLEFPSDRELSINWRDEYGSLRIVTYSLDRAIHPVEIYEKYRP